MKTKPFFQKKIDAAVFFTIMSARIVAILFLFFSFTKMMPAPEHFLVETEDGEDGRYWYCKVDSSFTSRSTLPDPLTHFSNEITNHVVFVLTITLFLLKILLVDLVPCNLRYLLWNPFYFGFDFPPVLFPSHINTIH